jgi:RND superfamily putative drug exporter
VDRVTDFCLAHRRLVIAGWVVLLVVVAGAAGSIGSNYQNVFKLPGTESQRATDLLKERFPQASGDSAQVVFHVNEGTLRSGAARGRIDKVVSRVGTVPEVASVQGPFTRGSAAVSRDGRTAFATVNFTKPSDQLKKANIQAVQDRAQGLAGDGLQVELGGQPIEVVNQNNPGSTELIGILAASVVLVMTFGSLVAAGLPLLTALLALGTGLSLVGILSTVIDVADFAPQLAAMIGLGVGIDYALFIVTRYREELGHGRDHAGAARVAMQTAGRAVLFAGCTVIIALMGMMLLGISFLYGLAVAASVGVLFTMLAALTLLPALLVAIGSKIDRLSVRRRRSRERSASSGAWARWSDAIARRPWPAAIASFLVLLVIALPFLSLNLGSADAGSDKPGTTTRKAYDLLTDGFGAGFNGPLLLAVETPRDQGGAAAPLARLRAAVARQPGVASVTPPQLNRAGDAAVLQAYPTTSPQSQATKDLVGRLRDSAIPPVERATGLNVSIGGSTATFIDFNRVVSSKLPLFIGIVVLLSVLLLMAVFRSILVPIKAAVMNVLSIGAAFGVVVAVFQWGWGASLIGVDSTGPIESFLPVMVFAIVFGLSMDYEVFLMSRIHEEWERSGDAQRAVTLGLARTARVITAAATIMVLVFGSFILLPDRVIKLFGLGLASAVFIDAFLIRSMLVPAVMHLLGRRAWWFPAWLQRTIPDLSIDGPITREPEADRGLEPSREPAAEPSRS